jgi:hypothetical protein
MRTFTRAGRRVAAWLLTAGLVVGLTACTDKGDNDVQTRAPEQATGQVKEYADATRAAAGVDAFSQANENQSPCEGRAGELSDTDEVYYIQGNYQLMVPAERQGEALAAARQRWQGSGFTIKTERSFGPGGTGEVTAVTDDGFTLTLTSGQPPAMLLVVASPCYRR